MLWFLLSFIGGYTRIGSSVLLCVWLFVYCFFVIVFYFYSSMFTVYGTIIIMKMNWNLSIFNYFRNTSTNTLSFSFHIFLNIFFNCSLKTKINWQFRKICNSSLIKSNVMEFIACYRTSATLFVYDNSVVDDVHTSLCLVVCASELTSVCLFVCLNVIQLVSESLGESRSQGIIESCRQGTDKWA